MRRALPTKDGDLDFVVLGEIDAELQVADDAGREFAQLKEDALRRI